MIEIDVMVDPGLFGDVQKGNCTWNQMQLMYSTDSDNLPVFLSLDRFVPKNVGFAKSRQITNISRQILIKPKSFTWNQMQLMYSTDSDNLLVFLSLNRFVPKNVGFAKSHQISNISRQILIKPKSFTWKYIRMNPNVIFSHKVERSQSP